MARFLSVLATLLVAAGVASAQTRTPWEMHQGLGVDPDQPRNPSTQLVRLECTTSMHGDPCEYGVSVIPGDSDPAWRSAPNGDTIGMDWACTLPNGQKGSLACYPPTATNTLGPIVSSCFVYADFTYFQTFVDVPLNVDVTQFTIAFSGMDDGSRVSIFNSQYPMGLVVPGSYVFLGGAGTTNLAPYVISGEVNRVVITQIDDCCCENHLHSAQVVLNGQIVPTGCQITGCDDGDACTVDVCQADFTCAHTAVTCDDGNACTVDACDPTLGCVATPLDCNDGNACTTDTCDAAAGCLHAKVDCNDGNVCTLDACDPAVGCQYAPVDCDDGVFCTEDTCDPAAGCQHVDQCPDCSHAGPTTAAIWPPNHKWVGVGVQGVTDPQGQTTTIAVTAIAQDEPTNTVGDGNTCADGAGVGGDTAWVRAERTGTPKVPGDGRVYHVFFTATDPDGFSCSGEVTTCVPHDQGGRAVCVDEGPLYDSLVCR